MLNDEFKTEAYKRLSIMSGRLTSRERAKIVEIIEALSAPEAKPTNTDTPTVKSVFTQ